MFKIAKSQPPWKSGSVTLNSKQTNPLANGQGLLPLSVLLDKAIKDFPFNLHTLCREGGLCMSLHDHFQSLTNKALFRLCWMQLSCIKKIQYLENKYLELSRSKCDNLSGLLTGISMPVMDQSHQTILQAYCNTVDNLRFADNIDGLVGSEELTSLVRCPETSTRSVSKNHERLADCTAQGNTQM